MPRSPGRRRRRPRAGGVRTARPGRRRPRARHRSSPIRAASAVSASSGVQASRPISAASESVARSVSRLREVTTVRHPGAAGSRGATCSASRALSRTTISRRDAARSRSRAPRSPVRRGISPVGAPRAVRKPPRASPGSRGRPESSKPRRFTHSLPSGKCSATRCAQCTARVVLPTPAMPAITTTPPRGSRSAFPSPLPLALALALPLALALALALALPLALLPPRAVSSAFSRPRNTARSGGSCWGAWALRRVAARTRSRRSCSSRPRAPIRSLRVAWRGRLLPRSMSLMARTLTPEVSASRSSVNSARCRASRSSRPNALLSIPTPWPGSRATAPECRRN